MKYFRLILILLLGVSIASCSGAKNSDPSQATFDYLTALAAKDKTSLVNLSCKSWEEQANLEADALLSVEAALNNVSCKVTGHENDFQLVNCTGKLDMTYGKEVRSIDLGLRTYYMSLEDGQWRVCSYK